MQLFVIDSVQKKLTKNIRNLTSDYTQTCRWRSVSQKMWSRRCDTAEMCDMSFWRVGIARNAMFFHRFVASPGRKVSSKKRAGAEDRLLKMSTKLAPRLRARERFGSQNREKTDSLGALLEVEVGKICTACARQRFGRYDWAQTATNLQARELSCNGRACSSWFEPE